MTLTVQNNLGWKKMQLLVFIVFLTIHDRCQCRRVVFVEVPVGRWPAHVVSQPRNECNAGRLRRVKNVGTYASLTVTAVCSSHGCY